MVVVEAARTGGALITAVKAAEYGLPVFAMPGDVDRTSSEGCNLLIRDGAFPVLDPEDLVEELRLVHALAESAADLGTGAGSYRVASTRPPANAPRSARS